MSVHQVPFPDGDGGGSAEPEESPEVSEPEKPGGPLIDYEFGDSQGWNDPAGKPGGNLGLSLLDQGPPDGTMGLTLMPKSEHPGLLKQFGDAYNDLSRWGVIGGIASTATVMALAPVGGVLAGIGVAAAALSAAYSWLNVAVHVAGGGEAIVPYSGLFSPIGLPVFLGESLGGAKQATALEHAQRADHAYKVATTLQGLKKPESIRDALKSAIKLDSTRRHMEKLGKAHQQSPQPGWPLQIQKPGGPVRIIMP